MAEKTTMAIVRAPRQPLAKREDVQGIAILANPSLVSNSQNLLSNAPAAIRRAVSDILNNEGIKVGTENLIKKALGLNIDGNLLEQLAQVSALENLMTCSTRLYEIYRSCKGNIYESGKIKVWIAKNADTAAAFEFNNFYLDRNFSAESRNFVETMVLVSATRGDKKVLAALGINDSEMPKVLKRHISNMSAQANVSLPNEIVSNHIDSCLECIEALEMLSLCLLQEGAINVAEYKM